LSALTNSAALRADAAESALCAYLSWIALMGIGLNAIWQIGWADATAALIIVPLIVREHSKVDDSGQNIFCVETHKISLRRFSSRSRMSDRESSSLVL